MRHATTAHSPVRVRFVELAKAALSVTVKKLTLDLPIVVGHKLQVSNFHPATTIHTRSSESSPSFQFLTLLSEYLEVQGS
jgi:hypothetical protein